MSVGLFNTTTNDLFYVDIEHTFDQRPRLSPGSYKVVSCTVAPFSYELVGRFTVITFLNGRRTLTTVDQTPLNLYYPFNIEDPNFLIVASKEPFGEDASIRLRPEIID